VDNTAFVDDFHVSFFSLEAELNLRKKGGIVWEPLYKEKWENCLLQEEESFEKYDPFSEKEVNSIELDPFLIKKINEIISLT
jgi:hypothetical protein